MFITMFFFGFSTIFHCNFNFSMTSIFSLYYVYVLSLSPKTFMVVVRFLSSFIHLRKGSFKMRREKYG
jgi:hypothetical protein